MLNFVSHFYYYLLFQEEQKSYQGTQHSGTWFEGSLFPYTILALVLDAMRGLLVEAALVLLAQSALHCREISLHHLYRTGIRDNVLGPREKTVSLKQISLSLSLSLSLPTFRC